MSYRTQHTQESNQNIFSGECKGTQWAVNNARDIIRDTLNKWELQDRTIWHIEASIDQETVKVDTQEHSLQNHEKAIGLIGLWTNPTIKYIKNKLKDDLNIQDQKALLMVYQLMYIQLDMSLNIYNFITRWKQIWIKNALAEELAWSLTDPVDVNNERMAMIASGLWPTQSANRLSHDSFDFGLEHVRLAAIDWAISAKTPINVIIQHVQQGSHKVSVKWVKALKEYKEWQQNPGKMARRDLFICTKDKSIKIKPKFISTGLYNGIYRMAKTEPEKPKCY